MSNHKLLRIEKQTDNKWLNIYKAVYETENGEYEYEFASRRSQYKLALHSKNLKPDAVRIIPYLKKDGKIFVVLIKEYRYPINRAVYGVPAGLIDEGETAETAAIRELMEEVGADAITLNMAEKTSFTSAGLTDESIMCFEAEVKLNSKQHLDESEDIKVQTVELSKLPEMLDKYEFPLQSRLLLRTFYYKQKVKELENTENTEKGI